MFEPFYTNYNGFAAMMGVTPVPVTTRAEDGYHLPARAAIEAKIGPRTRAILICSPNNPTGTVYTDAEIDMLAAICRERGLTLVADEVYREFVYDGRKHRSALTLPGMERQVVVVDSVSKRYSLCGARIGNIVSRNREFMAAILRFGQARLCPPTVEQFACTALTEVPASYIAGVIAEYQKRRDMVYAALTAMPGVLVRRPEGAFYICARLPVDDANAFAEWLLEDFDAGRRDGDGGAGRRLLRHAGAGPRRGAHRLRARGADARAGDEVPGCGAGRVPGAGGGGREGVSAARTHDRPAGRPTGRSSFPAVQPGSLSAPPR